MISKDGKGLVFLLSLPRSGSTILSLLLANHSAISCPPEPWMLLRLSSLKSPSTLANPFDDELARIGLGEFMEEDMFKHAFRAFAVTAYNAHLQNANASVFVDKTPRYYHILDFIDDAFPKSKKIWLKRNPLDVASSYKEAWGIDIGDLTGGVTTTSYDFCFGLHRLLEYFSESSPTKLITQYEDLARSPEECLEHIFNFLDLPGEDVIDFHTNKPLTKTYTESTMGDKHAPHTKAVTRDSAGKWRERLSKEEIEQLLGTLGTDVFSKMGYEETIEELKELTTRTWSEDAAAEHRKRIVADLTAKLEQGNAIRTPTEKRIRQLASELQTNEHARLASARIADEELRKKEKVIAEIEIDRAARLELIDRLNAELNKIGADGEERLVLLKEANNALREKDKAIAEISADHAKRLELINRLSEELEDVNKDRAERLRIIDQLVEKNKTLEHKREGAEEKIRTLDSELAKLKTTSWYLLSKRLRIVS